MIDYQKLDAKLQPVNRLIDEKKARQALAKIDTMLRIKAFRDGELWRVYQLRGDCYAMLLDMEQAVASYEKACMYFAETPLRAKLAVYSNYLFLRHYQQDVSASALAAEHFAYQQLAVGIKKYTHPKRPHKKIRIGYIADKFIMNVITLFTLQLLTDYTRDEFEVYVYSLSQGEDDITRQIQENVTDFRIFNVSQTTAADVAAVIFGDEIDILFDLSVHTYFGFTVQVMCYKPAPIQLAGIGYMSTSGIRETDYFLTDVYLDPPGCHEEFFSEQLLRLPHSHFCHAMPPKIGSQHHKVHEQIVFASFNNFAKITDKMLSLWKRIVDAVPGSKILFKNSTPENWKLAILAEKIRKCGYKPEQYEIEAYSGEYRERYMDVDILLDTYPYVGGATTFDALLCGTPVITMYGDRHNSRFGYSILANLSLHDELAADSAEMYIAKAVKLAGDRERLLYLHTNLPTMMKNSPLLDREKYVRTLEEKYKKIYHAWIDKISES